MPSNAVLVSAIQALLDAAHIPHVLLDQNMSVLEGSIGILPRRFWRATQANTYMSKSQFHTTFAKVAYWSTHRKEIARWCSTVRKAAVPA